MGGKRHVWLGTLRIRFGLVHQITYLSSPQPTPKAVFNPLYCPPLGAAGYKETIIDHCHCRPRSANVGNQ